jgi:DNA end-binding protein Ku
LLPASGADAAKVTPAELSMAKQLVESMAGKFEPKRFKDTYRADLKRRVQEKIKKKETHSLDTEMPVTEKRPKAEVIDLMEALRASLGKGKSPKSRAAPKKGTAKRKQA